MKLRIHVEDEVPHLAIMIPLEDVLNAIGGEPGSIMSYVAPTLREAIKRAAANFGINLGGVNKRGRRR